MRSPLNWLEHAASAISLRPPTATWAVTRESDAIAHLRELDLLLADGTPRAPRRLPRLVVLTDIPFWEPTLGSHVRVAALLKAVDGCTDLTVFSFRTIGPNQDAAIAQLGLRGRVVSYKGWEQPKQPSFERRLSKHPALASSVVEGWAQAAYNFLSRSQPDIVLVEYINRSYLLDAVPKGTIKLLDAHDVMSQRTLAFARTGKKPTIPMSATDEKALMAAYDGVLAISRWDADHLRTHLRLSHVLCVPHAVNRQPEAQVRPTARRLLFCGGRSEANVEGLKWFMDQVWPLVRNRLELWVAGTVGQTLPENDDRVVKLGVVTDLDAVHRECDIAINPVFVGGGIKIKCLDAMANGLPCVTTAEGVRGLEDAVGEGLLVAGSRLAFAGLITRLADDDAYRLSMAKAAHAYAQERLTPAKAFRDLYLFLTHA